MIKLSTVFVAIILTLAGTKAHALIDVPTLRFAIGESPLTFQGGSAFPAGSKLGGTLVLNPMFLWDAPGVHTRLGIHFLSDLGTKYGAVATAGIGVTAIFYPLGLSSSREVRDDFSEVVKTRMSPYFQLSITPTKFSVVQASPTISDSRLWPYFNAHLVEISLGLGMDYPLGDDMIAFAGIHYRSATFSSTDAASASSSSSPNLDVSYSGMALLFGIMTNFY